MARTLAMLAGVLILIAVAHVTVISTGGYGTPHSWLTLAIAAGAGVSGICCALAWGAERRTLVVCFVVAIVAGETFGFIQTAERLVTSREALQAPLREILEAHAKAVRRADVAQASLAAALAAESTISAVASHRLEDAIAAKAAADAAVVQKSAEKGCLENCRKLLQAQVDAAAAEVEAARAELAKELGARRRAAEDELTAARAALALVKVPRSPTPLADRLGVSAWAVDLVTAALGSIAANGLACCLLVFGAHHSGVRPLRGAGSPASGLVRSPYTAADMAPLQHIAPLQHMARFGVERLRPAPGEDIDLLAIEHAYKTWRKSLDVPPLPYAELGRALGRLFASASIRVTERNGSLIVHDIALKHPPEVGGDNILPLVPRIAPSGRRLGSMVKRTQ